MESFQIGVGHQHGVSPREIVGAIANEGGIEGRYIGRIQIFDDFSTIDLPEGMPEDILQTLQRTRVCNQPLNMERIKGKVPEKRGRSSRGGPGKNTGGRDTRGHRSAPMATGDMPPPKRKPRRDAFIEPDRAPGEFTNAPKKSRAGSKIEKPKKRGTTKKKVNKDKGKRRTPKS
jgi:ATP-dependent RNA helicase DeaD